MYLILELAFVAWKDEGRCLSSVQLEVSLASERRMMSTWESRGVKSKEG